MEGGVLGSLDRVTSFLGEMTLNPAKEKPRKECSRQRLYTFKGPEAGVNLGCLWNSKK